MEKLYVTFGSPVSKPHLYSWLRANLEEIWILPRFLVSWGCIPYCRPITLKHPSGIPPTGLPVPALPRGSERLST